MIIHGCATVRGNTHLSSYVFSFISFVFRFAPKLSFNNSFYDSHVLGSLADLDGNLNESNLSHEYI